MALEHRLDVRLQQKLVLTPQLQQAIKLLQMPQLELSATLNNELIENPFLEESAVEPDAEEVSTSPESETLTSPPDESETPLERLLGFSADGYFDSRSYDGRDLGYFSPDTGAAQDYDQFVGDGVDDNDHLNWQLRLCVAPEEIKSIAEAVIGNIDEKGYLRTSVDELIAYSDASTQQVEAAIKLVQSFDPPGIAARDLRECLLLQLPELDLSDTLVERIIDTSLPDIEKRRYKNVAKTLGVTLDDVHQAIKIIEGLDPKPGTALSTSETIYIKPDVYVIRDEEDFRIVLNDESIPRLRINSYYRRVLSQKGSLAKEEKEYLTERLRSAEWLLKSLDHRNNTLYRVTESVVRFQNEFFDKNVSHLKPLNLKDVAQDLDLHESTISRATSNKYLSCSHGLFGFRFFFSSALTSSTGENVSSNYVRDIIKKIISEEYSKKPLSDQKISDMLKASDIKVARRTVAKYRDEMKISPQSQRRRLE